ncbi:MAG TPA: hypothetical protein VMT98_09580 [Verrucomicrobiae bacterium]|jgi:hypothetical protein|nr:hypothetical protein [Verrucomicrobiae bacterium]
MGEEKQVDHEDLIAGWIEMAKALHAADSSGVELDASIDLPGDALDELIDAKPDSAWALILAILARDESTPTVELLAAGPLENLLSKHGQAFIERVEAETRTNRRFARLLGGVWRHGMTDDVWRRVQAVWDRRGWDGIPK